MFQRSKLKYDEQLSNFAFIFNLRCYSRARTTDGATPLSIALFKAAYLHVAERLKAARADADATLTDDGATPLHVAALW